MIYRPLGNTGYQVSAVCYGGIVSMKDGQPASDQYVSWAIDQGINYFDVAPSYGDAQEKLGVSLQPYRKQVYLACKTNKRTKAEAEKEVRTKYHKSWCKPFDVDEDEKLLTAAVKYALSLDVDTIIPPGNIDHFRFAVNHIEDILKNPYSEQDEKLLKAHLEKVKDHPFFQHEPV